MQVSVTGTVSLTVEGPEGVLAEINAPVRVDVEQEVLHFVGRLDAPPAVLRGPEADRFALQALRSLLPHSLRLLLPEVLRPRPTGQRDAGAGPGQTPAIA